MIINCGYEIGDDICFGRSGEEHGRIVGVVADNGEVGDAHETIVEVACDDGHHEAVVITNSSNELLGDCDDNEVNEESIVSHGLVLPDLDEVQDEDLREYLRDCIDRAYAC